MRLGGAIEKPYGNPEEWVALVKRLGYSAVLAPVSCEADSAVRQAYLAAARENDLVIGEVGVWKNCLSKDEGERKAAMDYAKAQLELAEELGANCCVNIMGSRSEIWDGFAVENYDEDVYAMGVESIREIIDAVKPKHTSYSIESMPWITPDSPEQYLKLLKDVDRGEAFGVHLDFVNMINCPERYVRSTEFIRHCFSLLGPYIKSIHGKDVLMERAYTTLIHETMPGRGTLDYTKILPMVENLGPDTTFFIEHLPDFDAYQQAAAYIRNQAALAGVEVK
ncbi:MAG: sugar phosphate isomerase/epimerase [Roseburia sp.]|nr:sugar phosphate isomerase/epimerase [Roseburia sp.]